MNRYIHSSLLLTCMIGLSSCGVPEKDHTELSDQLNGIKEKLTKANDELDFAAKTVKEKEEKIAELETKIKIVQEQNTAFTSKEPELEQEISELQTKLDKVTLERDTLQTSLSAKDNQVDQMKKLQADLAAAKEETTKWKEEYQTMRQANENLQVKIEEIQDRPKDDFLFTNSLVRYLQQSKRTENATLDGKANLTDEEKATYERNKNLLSKSSKELTAEMGDYYSEKGTLEQMTQKYPDFAKKYDLILKLRAENTTPTPE
jgi:chromosome segregation ATPase